jgi:hypothetical protein
LGEFTTADHNLSHLHLHPPPSERTINDPQQGLTTLANGGDVLTSFQGEVRLQKQAGQAKYAVERRSHLLKAKRTLSDQQSHEKQNQNEKRTS